MYNSNLSAPASYLPLQNFHIVEITDLEPSSIKASIKKAKKKTCDREPIKHTTLLNAVTKMLGIKGGFPAYQRVYDSELVPFLNKHGMKKRVDLLKQRLKGFDTLLTDITHQDLSERLFYSGHPLPEKIFTGYNFDYKHTIDDGHNYFPRIFDNLSGQSPMGLKNNKGFGIPIEFELEKDIVEHNIKIARANPSLIPDCKYDKRPLRSFFDITAGNNYVADRNAIQAGVDRYNCFSNRTLMDVVVGSFMVSLDFSFNLLGDSLMEPNQRSSQVEIYLENPDKVALNKVKELPTLKFNLFRERIEQSENGWVDVIPFNNNLIFLRGDDGQYDFVFKNQRDEIFEHQIFGKALKRADIPSCISDYQFLRWHYFEYQGWRQMDRHCAENLYYEKGHYQYNYPGQDVVLQDYYKDKGGFVPKKLRTGKRLACFNEVLLGGKRLMVSQLITIDDLNRFAISRADYMEYRIGDNLDSVNNEDDSTLPVSVTWFDVLAYLNWFEANTEIPARLLTVNEYELIRAEEKISKTQKNTASDLKFVDRDGKVFPEHPAYMAEGEFQALDLKFGNIDKHINSFGLEFMQSNYFAEWLMEGTSIRSGNLKSFYNNDHIIRCCPPKSNTGKYKGIKTGFRICYELEE
ncbi:hypothetical protein HWV01_02145 [Moritella sp. 5]|uniref:hypothetical protein n=1 Tax=Moritella sp. 5 TaxID=2746231 RepID=UPI001BA84EC2|nr:hypothetical protein [Moritella sp. 5]QUM79209.1 hypothetical protein HWV01_02145 [Moritella sp. 5]